MLSHMGTHLNMEGIGNICNKLGIILIGVCSYNRG